MTSGSLLDLHAPGAPAPDPPEHRPMLTRSHRLALRVLLAISAPIYLLLLAMNFGPVGDVVFRLGSLHRWFALTFGIMVIVVVATYLVLLGIGLHHFTRGHRGPRPPSWWPWVMVILNVPGAAAYYFWVVEPDQEEADESAPDGAGPTGPEARGGPA